MEKPTYYRVSTYRPKSDDVENVSVLWLVYLRVFGQSAVRFHLPCLVERHPR